MSENEKPSHQWNAYSKKEKPDTRLPKHALSTWETQDALEELKTISSWKQFAEVCNRQKEKRGW